MNFLPLLTRLKEKAKLFIINMHKSHFTTKPHWPFILSCQVIVVRTEKKSVQHHDLEKYVFVCALFAEKILGHYASDLKRYTYKMLTASLASTGIRSTRQSVMANLVDIFLGLKFCIRNTLQKFFIYP